MSGRNWVPQEVDVEEPSVARFVDYLLGGSHNFAADRRLGDQVTAALPWLRDTIWHARSFLRRAVLFMIDNGVRQFLDLGSGIPTMGNVHEVAQRAEPTARVVYVDWDPVVSAHSDLLLADNDRATMIQADLCAPETVLSAAANQGLLDVTQPIGLVMVGAFHFVPEEQHPLEIMAGYREGLPSGSYLALSHISPHHSPDDVAAAVAVSQRSPERLHPRSRAEILALFSGFDLVEPGLVSTPLWRPESPDIAQGADRSVIIAGVGRKP